MANGIRQGQNSPGPGVDAMGQPVIDPTRNVLDLVAAAISRQDDLREMQSKHVEEILKIREEYETRLRQAESSRIDAIRSVDQARLTADAAAGEIRATALQTQVALSADAVRNSAAASTQAQQENLTRVIAPLQTAIEDLRRTQYQQQGEKTTHTESNVDRRGNYALVISGIFVVIALVGMFISFYSSTHRTGSVSNLPACSAALSGEACVSTK